MSDVSSGIDAAMDVARQIAEGSLDHTGLDEQLAVECRRLLGHVEGPGDPLWPLQVDVAEKVIGAGAFTADELAQWVAVLRRREEGVV